MPRVIEFEGVQHQFPDGTTDAEIDEALSTRAASLHADVRNPNDVQRLEILKAQLTDPARNEAFDSELRQAIGALEKKVSTVPAPAAAPQASQADVRKAEQPLPPMEAQRVDEARFGAARKGWMSATGGAIKPGKTDRESIAEWAGISDPFKTAEKNEIQHAIETGDLKYGDSVPYAASQVLAGAGGFALGGPAGATAAGSVVRATALLFNLKKAVDAGMDSDQAADIFIKEFGTGAAGDAALNFGLPVLGQIITKIPGVKALGEKIMSKLGAQSAPKPSLRDAKIDSRVAQTDDPVRQQAVRELSGRVEGDFIPTPGQVTGRANAAETAVNKAFPGQFKEQEQALGTAAEGMRRELLYPGGQPSAQTLGERVVKLADDAAAAVKTRLRPTFQAADDLGINVDFSPLASRVAAALKADAAVPGGRLKPAERADLEALRDQLGKTPGVSAEAALDFISRQKEKLRSTVTDGAPSDFFDTIVGGLSKDADRAYQAAAQAAGKGDVVKSLLAARDDYRKMMATVYDDAIKQALRKEGGGSPEDIGQFLWQNGKVSRIEQLDELLQLARKEGVAGAGYTDKLRRDVTRGFLQEAVKDVKGAAEWSKTLASDPRKARTWEVLTAGPAGQALRDGMHVLEEAAKIATVRDTAATQTLFFGIAAGRAAQGGLGISYVTGALHPGMVAVGLSIAAVMKAMSTAYVRGDKGSINFMTKVLRTYSAGTGASAKALQAMLPELEEIAQKYDASDMFVPQAEAGDKAAADQKPVPYVPSGDRMKPIALPKGRHPRSREGM